ncbi:MAG TPA: hypothetical protein VEC39_11125 [Vicinamibacterales bacterium]|nr:hypothetical protein [Vicinamibacterales bacterium]
MITRRDLLKAASATLLCRTAARAQDPGREVLYNGITLPSPWPPRRHTWDEIPQRPPYLVAPPPVINIDTGRQLFVDDFLIEESGLHRAFHSATYHPASPVLRPVRDWERRDPYERVTGHPSPTAMVFSDGVFFDPDDRVFKMWYMAGYQQHTALAISRDGVEWTRPSLPIVPGTNIVVNRGRDSTTVWLDCDAPAAERYKMAAYDLEAKVLRLHISRDGVRWREVGQTGTCGDRSTFFRNPFRKVWVFSLRADRPGTLTRYRRYIESHDFISTAWSDADPVIWAGSDSADLQRDDLRTTPQLYNLDAVAYESVMLGLFTLYRGERQDREKPNDICVGFSRDGFHWTRDARDPFIPVSERAGDWNWGNVQSAGGGCVIVGDTLHFYVSGRKGVTGTNLPGECTTGLATLRRDGFASITDQFPAGAARPVSRSRGALVTRVLRSSGGHLFVNANIRGSLKVEVLDRAGQPLKPFTVDRCVPVTGDGTRLGVEWTGSSLATIAGQPIRLRFVLDRAHLFAFWISPSPAGHSRGYVAGGGPGYSGALDA